MNRPWPEFKEELEARMGPIPSYDLTHGNFNNYENLSNEEVYNLLKEKDEKEANKLHPIK